MNSEIQLFVTQALQPIPENQSDQISSRELVCKAINFQSPERIPFSLVNPVRSDFFEIASLLWWQRERHQRSAKPQRNSVYFDEWHIKRQPSQGLFDQVLTYPLQDLNALVNYRFPSIKDFDLFKQTPKIIEQAFESDKYIVGYDPVNLYDRVIALCGIETALLAPYNIPKCFEQLLDELTEISLAQIAMYANTGKVQAFMSWQDFGTQDSLVMSLEMFNKFYRPRLQRMVDACHQQGMHFIWHCCGAIYELIDTMVTMGVDVVQLDQARLIGYQKLADAYAGEICFWTTLDTLWSTQTKSSDTDICKEVNDMVQTLNNSQGGLMLRHYPQAEHIGLAVQSQLTIEQAFLNCL
jgi:uroporphyrinogen decarboxylase